MSEAERRLNAPLQAYAAALCFLFSPPDRVRFLMLMCLQRHQTIHHGDGLRKTRQQQSREQRRRARRLNDVSEGRGGSGLVNTQHRSTERVRQTAGAAVATAPRSALLRLSLSPLLRLCRAEVAPSVSGRRPPPRIAAQPTAECSAATTAQSRVAGEISRKRNDAGSEFVGMERGRAGAFQDNDI